jgi:hypothetical protein
MIFIERIIFSALQDGLDRLIAKPVLFKTFLMEGGLSEDEATRGQEYFEANPPRIIHGFARADGYFPCWAIVLGGESTDADYLGEDAFDTYLDEPDDEDTRQVYVDSEGNRVDPHSRRWGHNFEVYTYAENPDITLYDYYLAKQILAEQRSLFQEADLDEITYTGADLAPDPRYMPSGLFVRRLSMKMSSDQVYVERRRPGVGLGTTLAGAHVAEDASDATDATALITPESE